MKKFAYILTFVLAGVLLLSTAACASKYEASECSSPLVYPSDEEKYFYRPEDRPLDFDRKIEEAELTFYYESGLDGRKIDRAVDGLKQIAELDCCEIPQPVYLLKGTVTHVNGDGLWLNPNDPAELILAVLLEHAADTSLPAVPFGLFAGVAAALLQDGLSFPLYDEEKLEARLGKYPYVKELQYPLYTDRIATDAERETAWNYAYRLGELWLKSHGNGAASSASWEEFYAAITEYGATMPETYHFVVGDGYYPTQILTPSFCYYFAHNFKDSVLPKEDFAGDYAALTAFVTENEAFAEETAKLFGLEVFPQRISCFFGGEEFNVPSVGLSDYRNSRIVCHSVGVFSYFIVDWVHQFSGYRGYPLQSAVNSMFAYAVRPTTYAARYDYRMDYLGYGELAERDETLLKEARALYRKQYGKPSAQSFSSADLLDCIAYCADLRSPDTFIVSGQTISLSKYVYETYGFDALMNFSLNTRDAVIEGKTFETLKGEWRARLRAKFSSR